MTCPVCGRGVMEQAAYIELKGGELKIITAEFTPSDIPAIEFTICSLNECGYTQLTSAKNTLSLVKQARKEELQKQMMGKLFAKLG